MKRTMIAAALALLMTSGAANAKNWNEVSGSEMTEAVNNSVLAWFAGNHDRCPRFKVIDEAVRDELVAGGLSPDYIRPNEADRFTYPKDYAANPSAFCKMAWEQIGPNGSYKRQMLEAK
jgi:hypothetical protein